MARQGTLTIPGLTVPLDDPDNGWVTTQLDLGYPDVREDTETRVQQHGVADYTRFFGSRVVTLNVTLVDDTNGPMTVDELLVMFAPFMSASARPVLAYALENRSGPEVWRQLTLRASALSAPLVNPRRTDVQLSWVAPDPRAYSVELETVSLWTYDPTHVNGRHYALVPPRTYPAVSGPTQEQLMNEGAVSTYPAVRFYGPMTGAVLNYTAPIDDLGNYVEGQIAFQSSFVIAAGDFIDVDTGNRTVLLNGQSSRFSSLDFTNTTWAALMPGRTYTATLLASATTDNSQCLITWRDAYLF
jgi:hypothetical protein